MPERTALASIEWARTRAVIRDLVCPADDGVILEAIAQAGKTGIDCPLGWPDAFADFVAAHRVHAGEPRDGGEHDLLAFIPAEQLGAAEAIDGPQVLADLGFVVMLVVIGGRPRRPSAPYPRKHLILVPPVLARSWTTT